MLKRIFPFIVFCFFSLGLFSQLDQALQAKLERSDLAIEGRVLKANAFLGLDGNIYTENVVEIFKIFKGDYQSHLVSIITEGGELELISEDHTHTIFFGIGDLGFFLLSPCDTSFELPSSSINSFVPSSNTSFYRYDRVGESFKVVVPGFIYEDIEEDFYTPLRSYLDAEPLILKD